jgi:hypothetical protein
MVSSRSTPEGDEAILNDMIMITCLLEAASGKRRRPLPRNREEIQVQFVLRNIA